jgi:cysteinyl-tRNA synthetase
MTGQLAPREISSRAILWHLFTLLLIASLLLGACDVIEEWLETDSQWENENDYGWDTVETQAGQLPEFDSGAEFDPWDLWVGGPHLRGANIYQRRVYEELDDPTFMNADFIGPGYTQEDFDRLAAMGANYVNISHPGIFSEQPPYQLDERALKHLERLLAMIGQADMFAVVSFRTGPGRSEFTFFGDDDSDWFDDSYRNDSVWEDADAQDAWVEMWRVAAETLRDHPIVVGYDLMVEPNSNEIYFDEWEPDVFYADYGGTLYDWNQLFPRIVEGIREVDYRTPILVGGMGYSPVDWLPYIEVNDDDRIVYIAHQYAPTPYNFSQPGDEHLSYPGSFDLDWDGQADDFDRGWLETYLNTIDDFMQDHGVPVAINEFGVRRYVNDAAAFLDDEIDILESLGVNWALWQWEVSWEPYASHINAWNFRFGADPESTEEVESSELMSVIESYWSRNQLRPSSFSIAPRTAEPYPGVDLSKVEYWLYWLDVDLEQEMVDVIAASGHDMVVIDFIPSESWNTDYPMAQVVEQLHQAPHPKLVIAYIDIGEAESYRAYWQEGWGIGNPEWIISEDPDGWDENYPVAYWDQEWQAIWLSEGGLLDQIVEAGFDGVYLDWVEAYSDERVMDAAQEEGLDPVQEMIDWVGAISEHTRSRCPNCVVIAQNAAELVEYERYVETIDAIAQEQVWFDGGADNEPPGDCPLPRSEAEIDSDEYYRSLPPTCQDQFDQYPDSTLHVSSQWYLSYLIQAQEVGLVVFTVDYALDANNIAWVYRTSRANGFIPLVTNRGLDQFVEPYPTE